MQNFFSTVTRPHMEPDPTTPTTPLQSGSLHEDKLNINAKASEHQPSSHANNRKPINSQMNAPDSDLKTVFSRRTSKLMGVQVSGIGTYVPENIVTNKQLEDERGIEPGWIIRRTGIEERRIVADGEATSDLCVQAALKAMEDANVDPSEIDLLVIGTFTPDFQCPSTACLVQNELGLDAPAFDVSAACSGFMYALITASQYIVTGNAKKALVIGADCNSRIVDQTDQKIAPIFGDGAGAVILTPGSESQGFASYQMGADGSGGPMLDRPSGGTKNPSTAEDLVAGQQYLQMNGRKVFEWAVKVVGETIELVLDSVDAKPDDVDLYLIHQANIRIVNAACDRLDIPKNKVFNNIHKYGNTSAASIPLAMKEARDAGRIKPGDTLLLSGFGAGLTWGTALFHW